jgi:hypothetical protein
MLSPIIIWHKNRAILSTLIDWAKTICDCGSLEGEMYHVIKTFLKNGYSTMEIQCALHPKKKHKTLKSKPTGMTIILYMQTVSGRISRLLAKYNIKTIHWPIKKSNNMLSRFGDPPV